MNTLNAPIVRALLILGLALIPRAGLSEPSWCHAQFESSDGTRIQLDYQKSMVHVGRFGIPNTTVYSLIQLASPYFTGDSSEKVQVVFVDTTNNTSRSVDLVYDPYHERYLGRGVPMSIQNGDKLQFFELAIQVHASSGWHGWLKDPISGNSNFRVDLNNHPGFCDDSNGG